MKKLFAVLLTFVFLFSAASLVFAENDLPRAAVSAVAVRAGDQVTIPVVIENNPGVMGFGLVITYDPAVVKPVKVERGEILSGLFEDNLDAGNEGMLKVLFAGSDDMKSDGTLFTVTFSVLSMQAAEYRAQMRCVQGDTFNAQWQDVTLACDPIVFCNADAVTEPDTGTTSTEPSSGATDETTTDPGEGPTGSDDTTTTTQEHPQPEPPAGEKLSVRIRNWAAGLRKPFNVIMEILTAPVVLIVSLFE